MSRTLTPTGLPVVTSWACAHPEHRRRGRRIVVDEGTVRVASVDLDGNLTPWTRHDLPLPADVLRESLRVWEVVSHEWSTDLLVEFLTTEDSGGRRCVEVWRLSPSRILTTRFRVEGTVGRVVRTGCVRPATQAPGERTLEVETKSELHQRTIRIGLSALAVRRASETRRQPRSYDLFVSYKSSQEPLAAMVVAELEKHHVDLWFAPDRHRARFAREVPDLIDEARHVLVLWSAGSDGSDVSEDEWERVAADPDGQPLKQVHEIRRALMRRRERMVCQLDDTPVHDEVAEGCHVFTRAQAARRAADPAPGSELSDEEFARAIAEHVLLGMGLGDRL